MKLYDRILTLLENNVIFRNSDNELKWQIWMETGTVINGCITKESFLNAIDSETIRRTRQKVQEQHPNLKPSQEIQELRNKLEETGGNFVYQEKIEVPIENIEEHMNLLVERWRGKVPEVGQDGYFQYRADKGKYKSLENELTSRRAMEILK